MLTIDEILRRMGKEGWTLRVGLTSPRQAELFLVAVDSFPGMMDEMFDSEPFGEEQMLADHTFNDLLTGRLIQKVSESDKWTYFGLTKAGQERAAALVLAHTVLSRASHWPNAEED
jgi:hypothetical protein